MSLVAMQDGQGWLMRPVLAGCCRYESLIDGSLRLVDVARMNDALDVRDENERRVQAAIERRREIQGRP